MKKLILWLEKKYATNQDQRLNFTEPDKYMDSEIDLSEHILKFKSLAAAPHLYKDFISLMGMRWFVRLFGHANNDIMLCMLDILEGVTESDTLAESEVQDDFLRACVDEKLPEWLTDAFGRIDEFESEEDAKGVTDAFQIIENLTEVKPEIIKKFSALPNFVPYLLKRIRQGE